MEFVVSLACVLYDMLELSLIIASSPARASFRHVSVDANQDRDFSTQSRALDSQHAIASSEITFDHASLLRNAAVEVEKIVEKVVEKEVLGDDFGADQTTVNQTQQSSVSSGVIAQAGSVWASGVVHAAPVQRSPVQYSAPVKHQPPTQQSQMVLMQTGTKKEMRFVGYDFNYLSVSVVVCVYVHACILPFIHILVGTNQNFRPRWWKKRKKNQAPGACALLTTLQWGQVTLTQDS